MNRLTPCLREVPELSMGCLPMGPLQHNLDPAQSADLIRLAYDLGIRLFDTAQYYRFYEPLRIAFGSGCSDMMICSKSYAFDRSGAREAVDEALRGTGRERIEIFMLHETESLLTVKGHWDAIGYYLDAKREGKIGAVGISTHCVDAVRAASGLSEIDVIEAVINSDGLGITGGTALDMARALESASAAGKGVIAMKVLGGGTLSGRAAECLSWVRNLKTASTVLCGMSGEQEIRANAAYFNGEECDGLFGLLAGREKRIFVEEWCRGCGACAARCAQGALSVSSGKAVCDDSRCVRCGYCAGACDGIAIRLIPLVRP